MRRGVSVIAVVPERLHFWPVYFATNGEPKQGVRTPNSHGEEDFYFHAQPPAAPFCQRIPDMLFMIKRRLPSLPFSMLLAVFMQA